MFYLYLYLFMVCKIKEDIQVIWEGIFDVVEVCFYEYGVVCIMLEMIGVCVGYIRGVVYWYFKNKSEVLVVIVECVYLFFMQELECILIDQCDMLVYDLCVVMIYLFIELLEDECLCKIMEIMLCSDVLVDIRVLIELQQVGFCDGLDWMECVLCWVKDLGQLCEGVDLKIVVCMLYVIVLGVLYGVMVELDLMDFKCDGMFVLDMILVVYVKDGVFVFGIVFELLFEV